MGFHTRATGYIGPANPGYCDAASMLSKGWNKVRDVPEETVWKDLSLTLNIMPGSDSLSCRLLLCPSILGTVSLGLCRLRVG